MRAGSTRGALFGAESVDAGGGHAGKPSVGHQGYSTSADRRRSCTHFENVFDWRSGPRRGFIPVPIPIQPIALTGPRMQREGLVRSSHLSFSTLGLAPELLRAVAAQGYTEPTPVQREAIPLRARRPRPAGRRPDRHRQDGCLRAADAAAARRHAATRRRRPRIRALILAPTRELAIQVEESVRVYGSNSRPLDHHLRRRRLPRPGARPAQRSGDRRRHAGPPARPRRASAPSTSARSRSSSSTRPIGCSTWASSATSARSSPCCPPRRQNLLFSATFSNEIRAPGRGSARSTRVGPGHARATPPTDLVRAGRPPGRPRAQARAALAPGADPCRRPGARLHPHQARRRSARRAAARRTASPRPRSTATSRSRSASARSTDFKAGRVTLLIATEVAARGLDIEQLPHVVNYELPMVAHPTTCIASAAPVAPASRATPSRWSASTRRRCCATSSACWVVRFHPRRSPASSRTARFARSRSGCALAVEAAASVGAAPRIDQGNPLPASSRGASVRDARRQASPSATGAQETAAGQLCQASASAAEANRPSSGLQAARLDDALEERARPRLAGVREQLLRRAFLQDLTVIEEKHAVGDVAGEAHLVGGDDHRHA